MAKKKKGILNQILGITEDITGIARNFTDPEAIYNIGKDAVLTSGNAMVISDRKNKIRKLLVDIGDRVYNKHIEVDNRNVKAEMQCIDELLQGKE